MSVSGPNAVRRRMRRRQLECTAHRFTHGRTAKWLPRSHETLRPLEELWSESVAVAHFCGAVVKRLKLAMPDAFAAGLLHRVGHLYILVQLARQEASRPRVTLSKDLVESWHPTIAKAVLKNWHVNDAVCEAVGMQADVLAVRLGPPTLTDVLVAGLRVAHRR